MLVIFLIQGDFPAHYFTCEIIIRVLKWHIKLDKFNDEKNLTWNCS